MPDEEEMTTTVAHAGQIDRRGQPAEHARAASCVPRGTGGPGQAANTPPCHVQPWGGS